MPRHQAPDGSFVHYRLEGRALASRPALILIHGWCGNLHHWEAQARHFSRTHRVLRMDRRGHGRSQVFKDPGTGRDHADDIAAIARRERIRRAVVVGSGGDGCPIALELTRSYPNLVRGTVLIDTPLNPQVTIGAGNHALGAVLGEMSDSIRASGARAIGAFYRTYFHPRTRRSIVKRAVEAAAQTPVPVALAGLQRIADGSETIAGDIRQPLLWLMATEIDEDHTRRFAPQAAFARVVGAGHFPQLETPAQVNAMLETFTSQL